MCDVTLEIDTSKINLTDITNFIDNELAYLKISYTVKENSVLLQSSGVQVHAAHPDLGKNAISPMIVFLHKLFHHFELDIKLFGN